MSPGRSHVIRILWDALFGLDLCRTDPAQHLLAAGYDLDDLGRDLFDV